MPTEQMTLEVHASLARELDSADQEFLVEVPETGLRTLRVERTLKRYAAGGCPSRSRAPGRRFPSEDGSSGLGLRHGTAVPRGDPAGRNRRGLQAADALVAPGWSAVAQRRSVRKGAAPPASCRAQQAPAGSDLKDTAQFAWRRDDTRRPAHRCVPRCAPA